MLKDQLVPFVTKIPEGKKKKKKEKEKEKKEKSNF